VKNLMVLGAGTAGTMVVNRLRRHLPRDEWAITIVDQATTHQYQPGYLFMPFGRYRTADITRPTARFIPDGVELVTGEIDRVVADDDTVLLTDGTELMYDQLVIATGATPRPDQTPGMAEDEWRRSVHDFYTSEGAAALAARLATWDGGRLVVHITEMPIKCPPAPLEFAFLADSHFRRKGMRDRIEIVYVTPLDGAFTKPIASRALGGMLDDRGITVETDFMIERVDNETKTIVSYDEREIPFDLLVTVPLNMGADFVGRSGLGDDLNYVKVDKDTFLSTRHDNIFALGDAADLPTSKAGSVAHFAVEIFADNFLQHIAGRPMTTHFDGHANCFVEAGDGRAMLIDFNYDTQPLPGKYPLPVLGPLSLLKETRLNHYGKLMFKWIYWNLLLPARPLPVPALMSMAGKDSQTSAQQGART